MEKAQKFGANRYNISTVAGKNEALVILNAFDAYLLTGNRPNMYAIFKIRESYILKIPFFEY